MRELNTKVKVMTKKNFDIKDLERWQRLGLITEEQLRSILDEGGLESRPTTEERKPGLNLITVVYYFGGFLALLSFTFFIGMSWADLTDWARFGIAVGVMLIVGAIGIWLRFKQNYQTAGGLVLFVAAAIIPLFIYTIARLLGVWPDDSSFYELRFTLLYLGLGSLAGSMAVLILTRFPLIVLLVAASLNITLVDIAQIIGGESFPVEETIAAIGGGLVLLGIFLTIWEKRSFAFWFKLYGLIAFQISFTSLFAESESILFGLLFLLVYLVIIGISIRFREVIFLIFGAIGFYTYIIRLVFDVFEGKAYFPLVLGIIGLSIIALAVLYQKYGFRLFRRRV